MALTGVFHVGDVQLIEPRDVDGSPCRTSKGYRETWRHSAVGSGEVRALWRAALRGDGQG
jgi:hypothetical protein